MVALASLAGCASNTQKIADTAPTPSTVATSAIAQSGHVIVKITDAGFDPVTSTVKVGSSVVWVNNGKLNHSVTPDSGGKSSGKIKPGATATHVATDQGMFPYHDGLHPKLKGLLVVK